MPQRRCLNLVFRFSQVSGDALSSHLIQKVCLWILCPLYLKSGDRIKRQDELEHMHARDVSFVEHNPIVLISTVMTVTSLLVHVVLHRPLV